jgi:pimeloyl-ACP methyl ester carboxylesterase
VTVTATGLAALHVHLDTWLHAARQDEQLQSFARAADVCFGLDDGRTRISVRVRAGDVRTDDVPECVLVAPVDAWAELLSSDPAPTMHHFLAMRMRVDGTRIEGDELRFAQHAPVIRRLLELARAVVAGAVQRAADPDLNRSGIAGGYVRVELRGAAIDLFVESAGAGQPLLVLHTAGADSRQAHPLMSDPELTAEHRVVAFDLPGHGRSDPVPGPQGAWSLDGRLYGDAILAVIDALGLASPILLGASMAGQACLLMAHRAPDHLGGVIACEAADHVPGRVTPWAGHPRVNESTFVPEWIQGLIGPRAPQAMHDAIWRSYSQGGHRTFAGDIDFYSGGWDGRDLVGQIDTARCPVVMMTGEYDYSCTPAMSAATADRIPGSVYWTMPGLGHFPICEHPDAFRPHLQRALTTIGAARG